MSNLDREQRIQMLREAHPDAADGITTWANDLLHMASESLSAENAAEQLAGIVFNGLQRFPDLIEVWAPTMSEFAKRTHGADGDLFAMWAEQSLLHPKDQHAVDCVVTKATGNFLHIWPFFHHGKFTEINWDAMQKTHEQVTSGGLQEGQRAYVPYLLIAFGLPVAIMQKYLEENPKRQPFRRNGIIFH